MRQDPNLHREKPLVMRLSLQSECPYLAGQTEQRIAVNVAHSPDVHDSLARAGFRRVENWVYRPACPNCSACTPWRVNAKEFKPSRNMIRIQNGNRSLERLVTQPLVTDAHYELFREYVSKRHTDGQMAAMSREDFTNMIVNSPLETILVNYFDRDKKLLATVMVDIQVDGLSAVYSFFNPFADKRSLGTFMVLDLLKMAKKENLPWLYLGYYVEGSTKMMYKARFQPAQIYRDGIWVDYKNKSI